MSKFLRDSGLLTFTEIQIPNMHGSRADIIAMTPHRYSTKDIRIYEVKLTKNAWASDKKYQKYLNCCNRLYIACPKGIVIKEELPKEVGLITRNDNGWHVVKSPRLNINPSHLDVDFILSLLYRGYEENLRQRDLRDRIIAESNVTLSQQAKNIGMEISRRLNNTNETIIENWCKDVWEVFEKFGFKKPEEFILSNKFNGENVNLPSVFEIECLLSGTEALMKDLAAIKAIGKYLQNIEYPEINEENASWRISRKDNRENALKLIG